MEPHLPPAAQLRPALKHARRGHLERWRRVDRGVERGGYRAVERGGYRGVERGVYIGVSSRGGSGVYGGV